MTLYCAVCKVSCPSDYQMKQHLQGRRHALHLAGGGGAGAGSSSPSMKGICFQFQNTGKCSKGASCTYKHIRGSSSYDDYGRYMSNSMTYDSSEDDTYCKYTEKSRNIMSSLAPISRSGSPPPGFCFSWWRTGICSKGVATCTYKHKLPMSPAMSGQKQPKFEASHNSHLISPGFAQRVQTTTTTTTKRYRDDNQQASANVLYAEFHICKTDEADKDGTRSGMGNGITSKSKSKSRSTNCTGSSKKKKEQGSQPIDINIKTETKIPKPQPTRLAPIFCMPVKKETKAKLKKPKYSNATASTCTSNGKKDEAKPTSISTSKFSAAYRNLFYRKRNVNLFIQNGLVVWEFAYNATVIMAIKKHIKGRAWNPSIGKKGCWTCPLESLPDAIALYEYMGRSASNDLKQRAKKIQEMYGGGSCSASDVIKTCVDVDLDKLKNGGDGDFANGAFEIGSVTVSFLYDADIVQSLRMLAPTQRSYDPTSKAWTIDLLALPRMLANLLPLGYNAPKPLRTLASLVNDVDSLLYGGGADRPLGTTTSTTTSSCTNDQNKSKQRHDTINIKDEQIEPTISLLTCKQEDIIIIDDSDDDDDKASVIEVDSGGEYFMKPEPETNIKDQTNAFESKLKAIVDLVAENSNSNSNRHQAKKPLNVSNTKRQKIAFTQNSWAPTEHEKDYDSDDESCFTGQINDLDSLDQYTTDDDYDHLHETNLYSKDTFTAFAMNTFTNFKDIKLPDDDDCDCDCGRPHIKVRGVHTCRYFGTFECASCDNRWTSAYCWKGEMQACRSCKHENYPIRKDQLDGSKSRGGLGAHDSANCGRCRKLGYNCTGYF